MIGSVVNLASRLESAAEPGRIYVGPGVAEHVGTEDLEPVGSLTLTGFDEPVPAWTIAG